MIAYLSFFNRYSEQFKRLLNSIYHPANQYLVHIDKNSGSEIVSDIPEFLADYPNGEVLPGKNAVWGGFICGDGVPGMTPISQRVSRRETPFKGPAVALAS